MSVPPPHGDATRCHRAPAAPGLAGLRAAVREELGRPTPGADRVAFRLGAGAGARARTAPSPRTGVEPAAEAVAVATVPAVPAPSGPGPAEADEVAARSAFALVQRAQAGDADAFGELYDRYVDLVYRYIYYRVGSQALAEDLCSETFLRALRRISSFTWQGRDVGAWFVTIARNLIADHYKSGRYRLEVSTADMLDADSADSRAEGRPEQLVLETLTNATLLESVKQLNPEQQECIVLRFLQGMSVAETALAMGKNEGAIKALQYRAVRTLGRLLPEGMEL